MAEAGNSLTQLGFGRDYKYPHDFPGHYVPQQYLPDGVPSRRFYAPSKQGYEAVIRERLERWRGGGETTDDGGVPAEAGQTADGGGSGTRPGHGPSRATPSRAKCPSPARPPCT